MHTDCDVVVVGASAGGVEALCRLVSGLPPDFPAAVFVTLHVPRNQESHLAQILDRAGPLPAQFARDGEPLRGGRIFVAVPGRHLFVGPEQVRLGSCDTGRWCPSVDVMFGSAAESHGERVAAVVLTGYLNDGAAGSSHVKAAGGTVIVQEPREAAAMSMPESAAAAVQPDYVLPLAAIPPVLSWLAEQASAQSAGVLPRREHSTSSAHSSLAGLTPQECGSRANGNAKPRQD